MINQHNLTSRRARFLNRLRARVVTLTRLDTAFVSAPEPRTIGSFARGRQLLAGNFLFAGHLLEHKDTDLWDLPAPNADFEQEIHGFAWLDDLASVGDVASRTLATQWLWDWIDRYYLTSRFEWNRLDY